jgi:hypothetical protein
MSLMGTAMEIKNEAAVGHLWLEEVLSGDRNEDAATVWHTASIASEVSHIMVDRNLVCRVGVKTSCSLQVSIVFPLCVLAGCLRMTSARPVALFYCARVGVIVVDSLAQFRISFRETLFALCRSYRRRRCFS